MVAGGDVDGSNDIHYSLLRASDLKILHRLSVIAETADSGYKFIHNMFIQEKLGRLVAVACRNYPAIDVLAIVKNRLLVLERHKNLTKHEDSTYLTQLKNGDFLYHGFVQNIYKLRLS